jgi:hypothetical protein
VAKGDGKEERRRSGVVWRGGKGIRGEECLAVYQFRQAENTWSI